MRLIDRKKAVLRYLRGGGILDAGYLGQSAVLRFGNWYMRVEGARALSTQPHPGAVLDEMAQHGTPALLRVHGREIENAQVTIHLEDFVKLVEREQR